MRRVLLLTAALTLTIGAALATQQRSTALNQAAKSQPLPVDLGAVTPRISPDGESLAFSYQGAIWRMPREGGPAIRLTNDPGFDVEPVWSPDGKRIAFLRTPNWGGGELQLIDAQTGKNIALPRPIRVAGTIVFYKLDFHPDGQRVLGVFAADGRNYGLSWCDLETAELTTLVTPPRWSRYALTRDGRHVYYTQTPNVDGQQGGNDGWHSTIWKVPSTGGEPEDLGVFPSRIHDLCLTPDDRSLIVSADRGGPFYDLWQVPLADEQLDLGHAQQLTFGQGDEHRPSISGSGWLLYTDNRHGPTRLLTRKIDSVRDRDVTVTKLDFGTPTGTLKLSTRDSQTGEAITARISIEQKDGKFHAPPGSLYRVLNDYSHFYCDDSVEFDLPAGEYQLRAFHGPEFRTTYENFTVPAGKTATIDIDLAHWTNPAERGWHSGENHIHANYGYGEWYNSPESMLTQSAGEDLAVSNFMVANSDGDGIFDRRYFLGAVDPRSTDKTLLYWNQEFRSTIWGHMTLINLSQLVEPIMTGFRDTTNPWDVPTNSDIARRTHLQNGLVNYTHVAQRPDDPYENPYTGKAIPIDVALGNIDSLDLNASYAGTVPLWYRLLNCGFRLTVSAGTDTFLNRIRSRLPGGDRVYVKLDGPLSYDRWIEGLRAGRSFVTNGPMLQLEVAGHEIGDTAQLGGLGNVRVKARVDAQFPIDRLEVISNGTVVATADPDVSGLAAEFDGEIPMTTSGWIAIRASGPNHRDLPTGSQYAHTSPVYVTVAGAPYDATADAEYFLKWIDRLHLAIRVRDRVPSDELRKHVETQLDAARDVYQSLIR